ncbi:murein biosynthesis integral membrane protein MurJ [Biomaibacter acetigenes]|uniref:murein biosynthesis integral membrane protein MurJ n=1 Tax=Biomaibacter acetigenes TaxID=2316383 RepID=UPI0013CE61E8|nr:murein biosynthesis integral membrane protein MurJ [Biomaibacter acetigenes]
MQSELLCDKKIVSEGKKYSSGSVAKSAAIIMVAGLLSKLLGFLRELLIGTKFGATNITDAYLVSLTVPTVIFATVAGALATTFIPVYSKIAAKKGEQKAIYFTQNLFNVVLVISLVISIGGAIFARPLVKLVAMGFEGNTLEMAVNFTRITMFICISLGLTNILTGFLQSHQQFAIPATVNIIFNVIVIGSLILNSVFGIWGLVVASVLGFTAQIFIQLPSAMKNGFRFGGKPDFFDKDLIRMGTLVIPVVIGTGVSTINTLVDRMMASFLAEGSISALNFANRLNFFALGLFISPITTVIYPTLSKFSAEKDVNTFKNTLNRVTGIVIAVIMPVMTGAIILRVPIIRFLFERGAFDQRATYMTATALLFYSIGMVGIGIREVLNRGFYSLQDTKTPMINGAIAMIINIILNLILVRFMGIGGLALSTSISAIICTVMLFYSLRKKIGPLGGKKIIETLFKSGLACLIIGVVVHFTYNYMSTIFGTEGIIYQALDLAVAVLVGALIYIITCVLFKVNEVFWMANLLRKKISKRIAI